MSLLNRKLVHVTLIVIVGLIIYANTLHVPFYFDDYINLVDVQLIKNLSRFADLGSAYRDFGRRYFGYLTFALNYRLNGIDVTGYHLVNIAIHLTASLLVYRLVSLTFRTPFATAGKRSGTGASPAGFIALFAALLFVAHPLQTQAVTYIVQRFASLAAMLYLMSLTSYVRARLAWTEPGRHRIAGGGWLAAACGTAVLAMLTKETAFTLPLAIYLYELMFFTDRPKWKLLAGAVALPALALAGIAFLAAVSGRTFGGVIANLDAATRLQTDMSRLDYLATQCRVIVTYLRLVLFPMGQRVDYDFPVYHSFLEPAVLASGAVLGVLVAAAGFALHQSKVSDDGKSTPFRLAAFGIFCFFITLSIESSIIPIVDVIFEHRMYLPSAGLFMALAAAVSLAGGSRTPVPGWPDVRVLAGAAGVVLILGGATVVRNSLWHDEVTFWEDNSWKSPRKGRVFLHLGTASERRGDLKGAEEAYIKAIDLSPGDFYARLDLGRLYLQARQLDDALEQFRIVLKMDPGMAEAHNNIGKIMELKGDEEKALEEYRQAIRIKPDLAAPHGNIGDICLRQKRYPEALKEYGQAIAYDPANEAVYVNRGKALLATGNRDAATTDFRKALQINPANAEAAKLLQAGR